MGDQRAWRVLLSGLGEGGLPGLLKDNQMNYHDISYINIYSDLDFYEKIRRVLARARFIKR